MRTTLPSTLCATFVGLATDSPASPPPSSTTTVSSTSLGRRFEGGEAGEGNGRRKFCREGDREGGRKERRGRGKERESVCVRERERETERVSGGEGEHVLP